MGSWLTSLFARSPFGPIQEHQHKVEECAELVPDVIESCLSQDHDRVLHPSHSNCLVCKHMGRGRGRAGRKRLA